MRVFLSVLLAACLVQTASAAFVVDLPVGNGELVTSSLAPTESEIYRVVCPRGAVLTVRAKVKLHSPRDRQELRVLISGPSLEYVTDDVAQNVTLVTQPLAASGEYRVVVSSKYGSEGDYSLSIGWKQRVAHTETVTLGAAGTAEIPFGVDAGTTARIAVRGVGGVAAQLVSLRLPDGTSTALTGATSRRTSMSAGDHVLTVGGSPTAQIDVSVRLSRSRPERRRLRIDGGSVPTDHDVTHVGTAGPVAGGVTAPAGDGLERASVSVPAGALSTPTALLLGTGPMIDRWDPRVNSAGPLVFAGPNGAKLRSGKRARVTIPYDPTHFPRGTSGLSVAMRLADGQVWELPSYSIDEATSTVSFSVPRLGTAFQVFAPNGTTVAARIIPGDLGPLSGFGYPLAIDGDWAAVGAPQQTSGGGAVQAGAVYVFHRVGGGWYQSQKLVLDDAQAVDLFGAAVGLSGDTLAIGSPGHDGAATDAGAVFVYVRSGNTFERQTQLAAPAPQPFETLGQSVAIDGDTIAAGAPRNNRIAANAGAAFVFVRKDGAWTVDGEVTPADLRANAGYPYDLAVSGTRVVAGAPYFFTSGAARFRGAAHVWARGPGGWSADGTLLAPTQQDGDEFGVSVAIDGDTAVVGARHRADDGTDVVGRATGGAYVFVRGESSWNRDALLFASDGVIGDQFGTSVAIDGDVALVGAPYKSAPGGANEGAAYAFTRAGSVWTQRARVFRSDSVAFDLNGFQVALSGTTFLVATYLPTGSGMIQMIEFAP